MSDIERVMQPLEPVLRRAGLPVRGWSAELLSRRDDAVTHRVVVKLTMSGHAPLVVKQVLRPVRPDRFERAVLRQSEMADIIAGSPKIHGFDAASQTVVMDFVPGDTLHDLFTTRAAKDHGPVLAIAGRWIDRFHRAAEWETRAFQPNYTLDHLERLHRRVRNRDREVPQRAGFLTALEQTINTAPSTEACETVAAINHGDLNLRNILIDGDRAAGIDFEQPALLPVAHDLARVLCHYATLCVRPGTQATSPLPGVDVSAFFEGYQLIGPDDQTLAFLCRARLLRDWQMIPKQADQRSVPEQIRHRGIQALAKRMFV